MTQRYRHSAAISVAAAIALIGALPLIAASWYYLPILLVPLAIAVWAWRAGTDVDQDGLTLRAALGSRRVPWSEVRELAADPSGRVFARLASGSVIRLPAVREPDLKRLTASQ